MAFSSLSHISVLGAHIMPPKSLFFNIFQSEKTEWRHELFRTIWEFERLLLELFSQASLLVLHCLRLQQRTEQGRSKGQRHPLCHLPKVLLSALAQFRVNQLFPVHPSLQLTWALLHRAWCTKGHKQALTEGWNVYEQPQTSGGYTRREGKRCWCPEWTA